jgi:HSP20 family protein
MVNISSDSDDYRLAGENQPDTDRSADTQYLDFGPFGWRMSMRSPAWRPPTDVFENENTIIVRVEIAGMREEDFSIELNGRNLTVRGSRQDIPERRAFHQMEIHFGEFAIELELPHPIDADQVQAVYSAGFLRIQLPKARPRQIPIAE